MIAGFADCMMQTEAGVKACMIRGMYGLIGTMVQRKPICQKSWKSACTLGLTIMKSRPIFLHALRLRSLPPPQRVVHLPRYQIPPIRQISTSRRLLDEQPRRPEPDNAPPQSPWKVFTQVLKEEIEKNQAWQQNVKELRGDVDKMADSAALKRAREMYEKTRVRPSTLFVC